MGDGGSVDAEINAHGIEVVIGEGFQRGVVSFCPVVDKAAERGVFHQDAGGLHPAVVGTDGEMVGVKTRQIDARHDEGKFLGNIPPFHGDIEKQDSGPQGVPGEMVKFPVFLPNVSVFAETAFKGFPDGVLRRFSLKGKAGGDLFPEEVGYAEIRSVFEEDNRIRRVVCLSAPGQGREVEVPLLHAEPALGAKAADEVELVRSRSGEKPGDGFPELVLRIEIRID